MTYLVRQLITEALYESGIVARQFEVPTGDQINDGFQFLNDVIEEKRIDDGALNYYKSYDFDFVQGQELYFIPDLIEMDTLVFYLDEVRYAMSEQGRRQFFGTPRAENIQSLMTNWHIERTLGGCNLYVYFFPNQAYPGKIWGLFALDQVASLDVDMSTLYDQYYINYLEYELAVYLCQKWNMEVPQPLAKRLLKYDKLIRKRSGIMDLQTSVMSTIQSPSSLNYGQINIGRGWCTTIR